MEWMNLTVAILSGLATAIPLAIKLVEYVRKAIQEKNWSKIIEIMIKCMKEAETQFENGASRKEHVMSVVKASADAIGYDVDMNVVGTLIDSLCSMSKVVNTADAKKEA